MAASAVTTPQRQALRPAGSPMPADPPANVGNLERGLSLLGGGVLALYILRRSLGNFVLLFGAGALLYRGLTGHCALYQTMAISTAAQDAQPDSPRDITGPDNQPLIVIAGS
jgi:uncharacterized membrane protein